MDILDRFYAFIGGGDIMRGIRIFNMIFAALAIIVVIIAIVCIIVGVRRDRKRKSVSLTSAKTKKAREIRKRGVFNLDGGQAPERAHDASADGIHADTPAVRRHPASRPSPDVSLRQVHHPETSDARPHGDGRIQEPRHAAQAGSDETPGQAAPPTAQGPRHAAGMPAGTAGGNPFGNPISFDDVRRMGDENDGR